MKAVKLSRRLPKGHNAPQVYARITVALEQRDRTILSDLLRECQAAGVDPTPVQLALQELGEGRFHAPQLGAALAQLAGQLVPGVAHLLAQRPQIARHLAREGEGPGPPPLRALPSPLRHRPAAAARRSASWRRWSSSSSSDAAPTAMDG